jgi:hypothetical protein
MRGWIISDDLSAVLVVSDADDGDFATWQKLRQQHLQADIISFSYGKKPRKQQVTALRMPSEADGGDERPQEAVHGSGGRAARLRRNWRSQLMHSSSLRLPVNAAQARDRKNAVMQPAWSASSVSWGLGG